MVTAEVPGSLSYAAINGEYLDMLVSKIKLGPRKPKIVCDSGNGTAGIYAPEFLRRIGCEVTELYSEPDGTFPNHHPDPTKRESSKTDRDCFPKGPTWGSVLTEILTE